MIFPSCLHDCIQVGAAHQRWFINSLVRFFPYDLTLRTPSTRLINNIAMAKTLYGVRRLILLTRFPPPSFLVTRFLSHHYLLHGSQRGENGQHTEKFYQDLYSKLVILLDLLIEYRVVLLVNFVLSQFSTSWVFPLSRPSATIRVANLVLFFTAFQLKWTNAWQFHYRSHLSQCVVTHKAKKSMRGWRYFRSSHRSLHNLIQRVWHGVSLGCRRVFVGNSECSTDGVSKARNEENDEDRVQLYNI